MESSPTSVRSATRPRTVGREEPRVFTPPLRPLTAKTSLGFECIQFAEEVLGMVLLPWQRWMLKAALELNLDGSFRFRTVVLLVARQNGKSTLLQVLSLWRMFVDHGDLVIGTAQNLKMAEEVWQGAVNLCSEVPELWAEVDRVSQVNGNKQLKLTSGERYTVAAADRRGGRGYSAKLVLMDELREHQSWDSWGAVTKTTMAQVNAQVWAASNAGDASSVVLRYLRKVAHVALGDPDNLGGVEDEPEPDELVDVEELAADDSLGVFEWSAPPGGGVSDREAWAQANPALGHTITERAISSAAATDPEWVFRTEVLCQWSDGSLEGPFPPGTWDEGRDEGSKVSPESAVALCVDVSWDRSMTYVGLAGLRADGKTHVEVIAQRTGTDWVAGWLTDAERSQRVRDATVAVQSSGAPASSLVDVLADAGVRVVEWKGTDLGRASGAFYDLVRKGDLHHRPQPSLDVAAATATVRRLGDAFVWDRKHSPADVSPLVAVTGAAWFVSRVKSYDLLTSVW